MSQIIKIIVVGCFFLACTVSCVKYNEVKEDSKPTITYERVLPTSPKEFADSIKIVIRYKDGDGDLGSEDPDDLNIYVKDNRLDNPDYYHLQALSPPTKNLSIEGELVIRLKNTFLIGSGNSEQTSYEVKLRDRAGNWSNSIVTDFITITK